LSMILTAGGSPLTVVDEDDHVAGLVTLELVGGLLGKDGALGDWSGSDGGSGADGGSSQGGSGGSQ
ncbi:MAG: hypothetical protein M3065_00345, partial [Actinomycetota bacterium]|nr:hypothetical protein [Actinomycetota bacterium]